MVDIKQLCDAHLHADWYIAQPDHLFYVRVAEYRFSHHAGRVCEVDQPCRRTEFLHVPAYVEYHRDCTQSFEQSTRPIRLLPKHSVLQRYTLIFCTCVELSNPELCCDERSEERRVGKEWR